MINGINHITLAVSELERSFNFYRYLLGFKPLCRWQNGAYFLAGSTWFCLNRDPNASRIARDSSHLAFSIAEEDFERMKDKIISSGSEVYKGNYSEGPSVYFLDPDGHKLEIHCGDYTSRLAAKKLNPGSWREIEYFND